MDERKNFAFKVDDETAEIAKIFYLDDKRGSKSAAARKAISALFDPALLGNKIFLSGLFSREVIEDIESGLSISEILKRLEDSKLHGKKREKVVRPVRIEEDKPEPQSLSIETTAKKPEKETSEPKSKEPSKSTGNSFLDELRLGNKPLPQVGKKTKKVEVVKEDDDDGVVNMSGRMLDFN